MSARRRLAFTLLLCFTILLCSSTLRTLLRFSSEREHYSHIVLIPLISLALVVLERRRIFLRPETDGVVGVAVVLAGAALYALASTPSAWASENDRLTIEALPVVIMTVGAFRLCFGAAAFRAALFPLSLLSLMVPLPELVMDKVIFLLQVGSAEVVDLAFRALGTPVLRTGFVFSLPSLNIEIAKECSGIRSSLALMITSLVGGHLVLRSTWAKVAITVSAIPLLVVKNGIRIVTLSVLAVYVDPSFLTGDSPPATTQPLSEPRAWSTAAVFRPKPEPRRRAKIPGRRRSASARITCVRDLTVVPRAFPSQRQQLR